MAHSPYVTPREGAAACHDDHAASYFLAAGPRVFAAPRGHVSQSQTLLSPDAARLIALADQLTPPSFAAYLHPDIYEGVGPGELDELRWTDLDFTPGAETIVIERQYNAKVRKITPPEHGHVRTIAMTPPARQRLLALRRESEWVCTTVRGTHYTPSSRSHHWNRVRCAAGLGNVDLYTATRHHFAWYAWNVLRLEPADIAQHFGYQDGRELVRRLYGHFDQAMARDRVRAACAQAPATPVPLAAVGGRS